jgi:hypothetical protein
MPLIEKRTEGQINAAKRGQIARLGGLNLPKLKRKKCKKGKSCGASCIPGYHVCMVDIPWALNPAITKVANQILAQRKSPAAKSPVTKPETKAPAVKAPAAKAPAAKAPGKKPKIPVYQVPEPVNKILTKMINNLLNNNKRKNNNKNPGNK